MSAPGKAERLGVGGLIMGIALANALLLAGWISLAAVLCVRCGGPS